MTNKFIKHCDGIDPHTTDVLTRFIRREQVGKTWMTKLQNVSVMIQSEHIKNASSKRN